MWSKASIRALLDRNPKAVQRALVRLYEQQEQYEKHGVARRLNHRGFSVGTAPKGCELAKRILGGEILYKEDYACALNIAKYHARQLAAMANYAEEAKRVVEGAALPRMELVEKIGGLISELSADNH